MTGSMARKHVSVFARKEFIFGVVIGIALVAGLPLVVVLAVAGQNHAATPAAQLGVITDINSAHVGFLLSQGVHLTRTDLALNQSEESLIRNETSRGATYVGILDYDTLGVSIVNGTCTANCNWTLGDWNKTVSEAVAAYPEVHIWEIWNEPDISTFQSGLVNGSPYNYYLVDRSAYGIIKAHNSTDKVLCLGGIYVQDLSWAKQAWRYGMANYCDAISLHIYTGITLLNQTPAGATESWGSYLNQTLAEYESFTGKPIWITETGMPTNAEGSNDSTQAEFAGQELSTLMAKPYIKAVLWYNLVSSTPQSLDFGLLNYTTMQPKPAWYIFKKFLNDTG